MIKKTTFRDEVKKILLESMFKGEIVPGQRISLPSIAKELEVSVTPVREALTQLTESRVVGYVPNRGFIVSELSKNEALDLYELIVVLESAAISSATFDKNSLKKLRACQQAFVSAKSKKKRVYHDMQFHRALIDNCTNGLLISIVEELRVRVFFYELRYMSSDNLKKESDSSHDRIIARLQKDDLVGACNALKKNWNLSIRTITTSIDNEVQAVAQKKSQI